MAIRSPTGPSVSGPRFGRHEHARQGLRMSREPLGEFSGWPSSSRAWLMVAVLMGGYTCAFIDRQILSLLVEPVRRDLRISDTQFSLLGGLAFMIFYIGLVMPLAWVADRANRRVLVSIGIAVWSVMTASCGL